MSEETIEQDVEAVLAHRPTFDAPEGYEQGCTDCGWGGLDTEDAFRDHMADLIAERIAQAEAKGAAAVTARVKAAACKCGGDGVRFTVGADRRCPVHGYGDTVPWRHLRAALQGGE